MQENDSIGKLWLTSQTEFPMIHAFPNTSRNKGNQVMKFGQLTEYNMRNIFLENHTQNVVEFQTLKSKLSISLYQQSEML